MQEIAELLETRTGIQLARGGLKNLLEQHLQRRRESLGVTEAQYLVWLRRSESEFQLLINAATVVYTWFYRDSGQFAAIQSLLTQLPTDRVARIWVPACATGEDAFTIALIARQLGRRCEILATDINTDALMHAAHGHYGEWSLRELPTSLRDGLTRTERGYRVTDDARAFVRFERHNLAGPPKRGKSSAGWDIVLCRNVLIYFDRERARQIFLGLADSVTTDGHLMLGASEVVVEVPDGFQALYVADRPVLRKRGAAAPARPAALPDWELARVPKPPQRLKCSAPVSVMPPRAAELFTESMPQSSRSRAAALASGHALLDSGDLASAKSAYLEQVTLDETNAEARMYAGIALYLCGEVAEAAQQLRGALFLCSELWAAAFYLALAYESMGLLPDAVREYRHVVRLSEGDTAGKLGGEPVVGAWFTDLLQLARQRSA